MTVAEQVIADNYAIYLGDSCEVLPTVPNGSVHLSIYSPPFAGLYHYSSSDRDLSNCDSYEQFFEHYGFIIRELARVTLPGRMTAVHCADVPSGNSGDDHLRDLPGDIIRAHAAEGWLYTRRYAVWKEPFRVRMRTMSKGLAHQTIVQDAAYATNAGADYVLVFRKEGENPIPLAHPQGLTEYAGSQTIPAELMAYRNWQGKQTENRYSHWIWRQYASSFWNDVRIDRVLPFEAGRDENDERHVHPLQLDVIDRIVTLWSNHGETVLTPFMGVGSEVWSSVRLGRKALGVELKPSYFRQAIYNLEHIEKEESEQRDMFSMIESMDGEDRGE